MSRQNNIKATTAHCIIVLLLSILVSFFDLFGIDSAMRGIARETAYDVFANEIYADAEESDALVILAVDGDLDLLDAYWPIDPMIWADAISEISWSRPRALFIDIIFSDLRDPIGTQRLYDTLIRVSGTFPVILPEPVDPCTSPSQRCESSNSFYQALRDAGVTLASARSLTSDVYSILMPGLESAFTVGHALALGDCSGSPTNSACDIPEMRQPTEIVWRPQPYDCVGQQSDRSCGDFPDRFTGRLYGLLSEAAVPRSNSEPQTTSHYPYQTVSLATFLLNEPARHYATDSVVFLGQSFALANDVVDSPIFGLLPGVFAHAAHYDNLVTFRDTKISTSCSNRLYVTMIIALLILTLFLGMLLQSLLFLTLRQTLWVEISIHLLPGILLVVVSILISVIELAILHCRPETWMLGPQMVVTSIIIDRLLGHWLWRG